jgi:hypothetical protein
MIMQKFKKKRLLGENIKIRLNQAFHKVQHMTLEPRTTTPLITKQTSAFPTPHLDERWTYIQQAFNAEALVPLQCETSHQNARDP